MLGRFFDRSRRDRVRLAFSPDGDAGRVAAHEKGTFVVRTEEGVRGAVALWRVEGYGDVSLGQAKSLDAAQRVCEAAAELLAGGRALVPVKATSDHGGPRYQAMKALRTMDGGLTLVPFGRPGECLRMSPDEVRGFLAGHVTVNRIADVGMEVEDKGSVLRACLGAPGLFGTHEAAEGHWGIVRHLVARAHYSTVTREERAADNRALDVLRGYAVSQAKGEVLAEEAMKPVARAASHLWDNLDVRRHIVDAFGEGGLEDLAAMHRDRYITDHYYPGR